MVVVVVVFLRLWFVGMTCGWKRALGEVVVRESRTVLAVWRLGRQASTKLRHMEIHVDSAEKGGPRGYFRNDLCSCCPSRPSPKTPNPSWERRLDGLTQSPWAQRTDCHLSAAASCARKGSAGSSVKPVQFPCESNCSPLS